MNISEIPAVPGPLPAPAYAVKDIGCFHCGLPLPPASSWNVMIDGLPRSMCCPGCEAVAQTIVDSGFTDYYRTRTALPVSSGDPSIVPDELALYDTPESQQQFSIGDETGEAILSVEGIRCAACVWLIERRLLQLPGVQVAQLNMATERLLMRWSKAACKPSLIFQVIRQLGYTAYPHDAARHGEQLRRSSRTMWRRLFVAGLSMMQVMMYAVPAYLGDGVDMEADMATLMRWASLLLTIPAVFYSAQPFFKGAWINLKNRMLGMDVPVALGVAAAFIGSSYATWTGAGEVYFDTVTMFVFLLLCSRYLEINARRNAASTMEKLQHGTPASAYRMPGYPAEKNTELVAASALREGDFIMVKPGDSIASDAVIVEGDTSIDLSLLSGESLPQRRTVGDELPGGAVNATQPIIVKVTRTASESALSSLIKLVQHAGYGKPQLSMWADKVSAWFVAALLVFALAVLCLWILIDPSQAWQIAVAVIVVSCPCALSLATPTALAAATDRLTREGILIVKPHVLETLHRATHVVFDKTGTLTIGRPELQRIAVFADRSQEDCLRIAAAMESSNGHPIAKAIVRAGKEQLGEQFSSMAINDIHHNAGKGLEAVLDGKRYRLGSFAYVHEINENMSEPMVSHNASIQVYLGTEAGMLACFELADKLRDNALELISHLRKEGKTLVLLSGDQQSVVKHIARQIGIENAYGEQLPEDKLSFVKQLQRKGAVVAMIGDGINDAAVLQGADVSFAMGSGVMLAQVSADAVLLSENLLSIRNAIYMARRSMIVIRQNLAWSTLYNIVAIPAAAVGLLNPWLSAVGMSVSSAVVVINALRLRSGSQACIKTVSVAQPLPRQTPCQTG
jgi:Cu2+-exporting ATPase